MIFSILLSAKLIIGGTALNVEIADTQFLRDQGLMGRTSLSLDHGMLFVYEEASILSFWMKNTKIPLSIGFFNEEKVLLKIEEMEPPETAFSPLKLYKSLSPAQYALETNKGWFKTHKIVPGMKFTLIDLKD